MPPFSLGQIEKINMATVAPSANTPSLILRQPRVTEKSTDGTSAVPPCYTFLVAPSANKCLVRQEVVKRYKVTPTKVNMISVKGKKVFTRGRAGARPSFKKAMVYLKPGDKIEFV